MPGKEELAVYRTPDGAPDAAKGAEGEERPVREKLEHAAISSQRGSVSPDGSDAEMQQGSRTARPGANGKDKPLRKRSLEDLKEVEPGSGSLDAPATPSSGTHLRKKTRELKDGEIDGVTESDNLATTATPPSDTEQKKARGNESPRKKRSAEDMDEAAIHKQKIAATEEAQIARKSLDETRPTPDPSKPSTLSNGTTTGVKVGSTEKEKASSGGGFANISMTSPFGAFGGFGAKAGDSKSAGLAGGFGAFGGSGGKSPFAGAAVGGASPFASTSAASTVTKTDAPQMSFTAGSSPFAAGGGGFGGSKLSSFASAKGDFSAPPAASKLSSFASPGGGDLKATGKLGLFASPGGGDFGAPAKAKPFGAPPDEKSEASASDDEGDGDDESHAEGDETESRAEDDAEKFHGPKVPEGEEQEETLWTNRAKIYTLVDGAWKERGVGVFKLNVHRDSDLFPSDEEVDDFESVCGEQSSTAPNVPDEEDAEAGRAGKTSDQKVAASDKGKTPPRFIMRAMQTQRLILNVPVSKEMKLGDPQDLSKRPVSKHIMFGVPEEGVIVKYLLKVGREEELQILYKKVKLVQKKL